MKRTILVLAAAAALLLAAVTPALAGSGATAAKSKAKTKIVTIHDNYYTPTKEKIRVGDTVKWKWPSDTGDTHDVKLKSGPKGAKKFHSQAYSVLATYKQKFTKAGTYKIVCTFHDTMKMTITVKK
jgi:plastocyanin